MKAGLVIGSSGPGAVEAVRSEPLQAEDLGFDSVWFTDHVVGARELNPRYEPAWAEALAALSYVAAVTSHVKVGLGVLVVPYRDPVYTARALATIDLLSQGRLIVGIGSGWCQSEFAALGRAAAYRARGAVTDEALGVMSAAWSQQTLEWSGRFFEVPAVSTLPMPFQAGGPPIWVGGHSPAALRRAGRFGAAWHPTNIAPDQLSELGDRLDQLSGRAVPRTARFALRPDEVDGLRPRLARYEAAGCDTVVLDPLERDPALRRQMIARIAGQIGFASR